MIFDELLALVPSSSVLEIRTDSRLVKEGDIFVAIEGTIYDGHDFIDEALARGAKYIVCQKRKLSIEHRASSIETIVVEDSAKAAAALAQASRANPASQLTNLAVTGTNGKTTVAYLVRSVIQKAGEKCGLISTIVYDCLSGDSCQAALTTPGCLAIAEMAEQILKAGSKYMVIEASSHGLSQNRLATIEFKAAAFTNLASDHLDYHKTREDYLTAKTKLFRALSPDATAVLNKQSSEAKQIARETNAKILWYAVDPVRNSTMGRKTEKGKISNGVDAPARLGEGSPSRSGADITAHIESMDISGTVFTMETRATGHRSLHRTPKGGVTVKTPLLGRYNVSNHLAAAGLCLAAGFDLETIAAGLSALKTIPGRLEKLERAGVSVFIDYAHTDDALRNVLATLKPMCRGKLTVVFGCGGDRDRTKRPRMARVAEQLADFVIVTSDNPRTEKPEDIIEEIVAGFENGSAIPYAELRDTSDERRVTKIIEPDRRKAIELAVKTAAKNDIILIAGKGHETYQIIGKQKFDFSDKIIAQECLAKRE